MDLAINSAMHHGAAHLWLGGGQVTPMPCGDTGYSAAHGCGHTRVLLWPQQQDIKANTLLYLDGQPYWVEAVENLLLHFCRVLRLTLRALGKEACFLINTGQGMA